MGIDIKSLKTRIRSVDQTLHLTKAMGLVASAKIRGATISLQKTGEYLSALSDTVNMLTSLKACENSDYLKNSGRDKSLVIVIAGDRGLAGGYNSNIFKLLDETKPLDIIPIGKRACDRLRTETLKVESFSYNDASKLSKKLCADFKSGKYNRVGIISTEYVSMMTQSPQINWILPLQKSEVKLNSDIVFEPDEKTVLEAIVEEYIASIILKSARESFLCEVVARRFAMDSAGKNATEMIENLTLEYNRARQGAITQEITEIVAGSGV